MVYPHHTFVRTFARLHSRDRLTEWWTVTSKDAMYALKDQIPFENIFRHMGDGGLVIYLDRPRTVN